jgi:hypothetical protein
MGQYYRVANITKKQFIHPYKFDDGLKLMEFGASGGGTMMGLAVLLAVGNGRGGGDLHSEDKIVGSWAGDKIAIIGDYADNFEEDYKGIADTPEAYETIYKGAWQAENDDGEEIEPGWTDISSDVITALGDEYGKS